MLVNTSVSEAKDERDPAWDVLELPATDLAVDVGNIMTASLVMVGAFASATAIVGVDALRQGLEESMPPYRRQHMPLNVAALEAGFGAVAPGTRPAWITEEVVA